MSIGTWGDSNPGGSWQEMGHRNKDFLWSCCSSFLAGLDSDSGVVFLNEGWLLSTSPRSAVCLIGLQTKSRPAQWQSRPHPSVPPHLQLFSWLHLPMFRTHQTPPSPAPPPMLSQSYPLPYFMLLICLYLSRGFGSIVKILPSPSSHPISFTMDLVTI